MLAVLGAGALAASLAIAVPAMAASGPRLTTAPSFTTDATDSTTATVGDTLTGTGASWSTTPTTQVDSWQRCPDNLNTKTCSEISGAAGDQPYTLTGADIGYYIRYVEAITYSGGAKTAYSTPSAKVAAAPALVAPVPVSLPVISGNPLAGDTLTTTDGTWDALPDAVHYQWQYSTNGSTWNDIGLDQNTYVVDVSGSVFFGDIIRVQVTASNSTGDTTVSSDPTGAISGNAVSGGTPTISGAAAVGQTLLANPDAWSSTTTDFAYQWIECDGDGTSNCADITGATAAAFVPLAAQAAAGKTVKVEVTGSNSAGGSGTATSNASAVIGYLPVVTELPVVSGIVVNGEVLSTTDGSWDASVTGAVSYQWQSSSDGLAWSNIGTDANSLTLAVGSNVGLGDIVRVLVTATNATGGETSVESLPTLPIGVAPTSATPTISDTSPNVGQVLTVDPGSWSDTTSYDYQWEISADGVNSWGDVSSGGIGPSYVVQTGDETQFLRVKVTGHNATGASAEATSAVTSTVGGATGGPAAPVNTVAPLITGTVKVGSLLTATTGDWTTYDGYTPVAGDFSYQWLQCNRSGGACTELGGETSSSYTVGGALSGSTIRVVVKLTYPDPLFATATSLQTRVVR